MTPGPALMFIVRSLQCLIFSYLVSPRLNRYRLRGLEDLIPNLCTGKYGLVNVMSISSQTLRRRLVVEDVNWTVFFFPARYLRRVGFLESHMQGKLVAWNLNIVYYYHDETHKGTMFC